MVCVVSCLLSIVCCMVYIVCRMLYGRYDIYVVWSQLPVSFDAWCSLYVEACVVDYMLYVVCNVFDAVHCMMHHVCCMVCVDGCMVFCVG